jgi:hypothetical protein
MVTSYNKLNDEQKNNIIFFLDKAQGNRLDILRTKYGVTYGRNHEVLRQNVIHFLLMEQIPYNEFMDWLAHVHLEGNNILYVYEPENKDVFDENPIDEFLDNVGNSIELLYNINVEELRDVKLVNAYKPPDKNQIIFTIAAPSQIEVKNQNTGLLELKKDIYLAYIIMDYDLEQFVLLMHPTVNLASIAGEAKKREWDDLTWILMRYFREKVISFSFAEPEWLVNALFKITQEYFHHNNPIIDSKLTEFKHKLLPTLVGMLETTEKGFQNTGTILRIKRSLMSTYESELVVAYGRHERSLPFDVFLQQSDKGVTEFKANSRGRALSYAEAADIIRLMWENGDIVSLGIVHKEQDNGVEKSYPYIISKTDRYYSFKKYNTSGTEKEVVDHVLRKLNKYKQEVRPSTGVVREIR